MPTDETRRVLKVFGVAVTAYEDAVDKGVPPEELSKAESEVDTHEHPGPLTSVSAASLGARLATNPTGSARY